MSNKKENHKKNNNRKRIAIISVHSDPSAKLGGHYTGGQNVYVSELSKSLGKMGWAVDIFTRLTRKRRKMVRNYGKNVNIIYIKAGPRYSIARDKLFEKLPEFLGNFLAYKEENKLNYSMVHGNYYLGGWVAAQIKRILNIPMVETFHSLGHIRHRTLEKFEKEIDVEQSEKRLRAEKEIMNTTDRIIATSPPEKRDIMRYYDFDLEDKIKIIPCGVNLKRFRKINFENARNYINNFSRKDKIIIYVGRIEWRKGIEIIIQAFPLVLKKLYALRKNLKIMVIGGKIGKKGDKSDKQEINRLKDITKELGIEEKVLFLGRKDQKKLRYYYSSSNIFITPPYYEPFGMTTLEAMRCGVPVIASNVGGLSYVVQNRKTGLLFPPGNHRILANKIVELFTNKKLKNKLIKNAEEMVKENYGWKKVSAEIAKLYQELL
ncbi:glycosyltransferase [Candidatus Parcubacteria bacterium]|nr:glycosyltransferase [Candidatus Parcubacteria bacterium]